MPKLILVRHGQSLWNLEDRFTGNSNRSIVMSLDKLSEAQVLELNLGTAVPLVYDLSESGEVLGKEIL